MELTFITDVILRRRIEDSIEYIYTLYETTKQSDKNELYQTETYRVIILYTVSIIEAVLFYIYEKRKLSLKKTEYKAIIYLPDSYKNDSLSGRVMLGVESVRTKIESEIGLKELVEFLCVNSIIKPATKDKLLEIIKIRNSVHLRQNGRNTCLVSDVDGALELLVYVITHSARTIN